MKCDTCATEYQPAGDIGERERECWPCRCARQQRENADNLTRARAGRR